MGRESTVGHPGGCAVTWHLMKLIGAALRSAFTWSTALPLTFILAGIIWATGTLRPDGTRADKLTRTWGRSCLRLGGISLKVNGLENVDASTSYVVVSNHLSGFDIMAHFAAFPIPIRFLAKAELFKIPVFGGAMRTIGIVEVDRGAGRSIHEHINVTATDAVAKGRSLIIYPEGTRPRDGVMQPFKKGAFTIATSMNLPVLPAAITGSREVWAPGSKILRPGKITVTIMPPISTVDMGLRDVENLRDRVHEQIQLVVQSTLCVGGNDS